MKSRKKKASDSLLFRLLGGKKKAKAGTGKKDKAAGKKKATQKADSEEQIASKAKPLTRRERSIAEVKQMTKIGAKDPERLARLLGTILAKEREKRQVDQDDFEKQVWDIVHRSEQEDSADVPPANGQPPDGDSSLS